ncbi:MAG: response regulator transcription factor [Verrucomicrobia bacterium]|nr:response regulator transcription factor [Verrucomicrobiota bacterium]
MKPAPRPALSSAPALFLADDHKIVRDGLRVLLERSGACRVVGDAADGRALVAQVLALQPEVVVTDLAMSELNGVEATRQLRAAGYRGAIVMLSAHDERRMVAQAFDAGVNAYVHKDHAFEQLVAAIAAARRGEIWLSPQLAAIAEDGCVSTLVELLTPREREVLQLFAEGRGTKEVAAELSVSPKTIEVHRLNLFAKLRVNNVIELTRIAIKEGLVQL